MPNQVLDEHDPLSRLSVLYDKSNSSHNPLLTKEEIEEVWVLADQALNSKTYFRNAYMAVETLLFQAYRGQVCSKPLPNPRDCEIGKECPIGILQSLIDRVESLNHYVDR